MKEDAWLVVRTDIQRERREDAPSKTQRQSQPSWRLGFNGSLKSREIGKLGNGNELSSRIPFLRLEGHGKKVEFVGYGFERRLAAAGRRPRIGPLTSYRRHAGFTRDDEEALRV